MSEFLGAVASPSSATAGPPPPAINHNHNTSAAKRPPPTSSEDDAKSAGTNQHPAPITTSALLRCTEFAASLPVGQWALRKLHSSLWCVENTLKFLLQQDANAANEPDEKRTARDNRPAIRPLPWLLLLPALCAFQAAIYAGRAAATLTGQRRWLLGSQTVSALQSWRRELRVLRLAGQRRARVQAARRRLDVCSRLARWLCERLFHIRSGETAPKVAGALTRKGSKIDMNCDLQTALNQTYNESDDLHDATFYPDDSQTPTKSRPSGSRRAAAKAEHSSKGNGSKNGKSGKSKSPTSPSAVDESQLADASDEHESSASSSQHSSMSDGDAASVRQDGATSATESSLTEEQHLEQMIRRADEQRLAKN